MEQHVGRLEVLVEDMNEKIDVLVEGFAMFKDVPSDIRQIKEDIAEIKEDSLVVKGVVREHSADIAELKLQSHSH